MNYLTSTPVLVIAAIILYIVLSVVITKYILSNGKNQKQIIEDNKLKATKAKDFLNKYPEANLKSIRKVSLAFGFIFAFASSIYAFSLLGQMDKPNVITGTTVQPATIFTILPPITTEKPKIIKKVVPPPPPKSNTVKAVKDTEPELPVIDEPQDEIIPDEDIIFEIPEEKPVVEKDPFRIVEEMPRFIGCEGVDKEEILECTQMKIQQYISKVDYPEIAIDNDMEGQIYVSFTVNEKGKIVDITLENKLGNILDKTTLKHVKKMPSFASAGKQRGKEVKVRYTVPVSFTLN